jgi:hypothetical protein
MAQIIYEGTREEILSHASDLKGKQVKLTVIDDVEPQMTLPKSLASLLKGKIGIIEGASPDLSENTGQQYVNFLKDKQNREDK